MNRIILIFLLLLTTSLNANFFVQDEWTKVFNVSSGTSHRGTINIVNDSSDIVVVRVTQSDFIISDEDEDIYPEPGSYQRSNANWITVQSHITLQAQQDYLLPFTIDVPRNPGLSGSYWSIIFIEEVSALSETNPDIFQINLKYAIQVITTIISTESIDLSVESISYISSTRSDVPSGESISLRLKNTGNSWVEANIKVDVYNDNAVFIGSFSLDKNRIYPGFSRQIYVPLRLRLHMNYHAIIVIDAGDGHIFGRQLSFYNE